MAEEVKKTEEKKACCSGGATKMILKIVVGMALVLVGAILWWAWRVDFLSLIKGFLGPFLILAGVIFFAIAKE